jgi:ribosomal protein S13
MRIIGIDHGSKESLVKECGAEVFLDITKFDDKTIAEEVKKVTGGKEAERQERSEIKMLMSFRSWCISRHRLHCVEQSLRPGSRLFEIRRYARLCWHAGR